MDKLVNGKKNHTRTKRLCHHANPLFDIWLQEWKTEAEKHGSSNKYNFNRAIISLRKFPLPVYSGDDCKILANFGDKICKMIDTKLSKYINENGPIDWSEHIQMKDTRKRTSHKVPKKHCSNVSRSTKEPSSFPRKIPTKKESKHKYVPSYRTGAYALIVALKKAEEDIGGVLGKNELIDAAQPLCDSSFTVPPVGSYYTAFSSMSTLIKKNIVTRSANPVKYCLTEEGRKLAEELISAKTSTITESRNREKFLSSQKLESISSAGNVHTLSSSESDSEDLVISDKNPTHTEILSTQRSESLSSGNAVHALSSNESDSEDIVILDDYLQGDEDFHIKIPNEGCNKILYPTDIPVEDGFSSVQNDSIDSANIPALFQLQPKTFDIILCVDSQETLGGCSSSKRTSRDIIVKELTNHKVNFDVRKLHIGDFLWICREKTSIGKPRELVLPFIIERKRMDDLAQSIKDGRFKEQKFRLKQSGLCHPIYLVEHVGTNHMSLPLSTCEQAVTNTQVIDGFYIKYTQDQKESAAYLTLMTEYLENTFKDKHLCCVRHSKIANSQSEMCDSHYNLVLFDEFNASLMKNRQLTIRDMFAKHLLQLSGFSIDKVSAILSKYPTPISLLKELSQCESDKEDLFKSLKGPLTDKAIGPALSKFLVKLYSIPVLS